jgi:hypothetical protein
MSGPRLATAGTNRALSGPVAMISKSKKRSELWPEMLLDPASDPHTSSDEQSTRHRQNSSSEFEHLVVALPLG